jgi:hypothetical protein
LNSGELRLGTGTPATSAEEVTIGDAATASAAVTLPARGAGAVPDLAASAASVPSSAASRAVALRASVEPLDAELRRLHVTVSKQMLQKLDAARAALSHSMPGASVEAILEAGLDLLLAQADRRRGITAKPRNRPRPCAPSRVPAHVRAAVWKRDQGRCQWKLDSGGICGVTHRVELDHVVPEALGGPPTEANLRCLCEAHNLQAAREAFGEDWMERFAPRHRRSRITQAESPV